MAETPTTKSEDAWDLYSKRISPITDALKSLTLGLLDTRGDALTAYNQIDGFWGPLNLFAAGTYGALSGYKEDGVQGAVLGAFQQTLLGYASAYMGQLTFSTVARATARFGTSWGVAAGGVAGVGIGFLVSTILDEVIYQLDPETHPNYSINNMSSARVPGAWGPVEPGHETNRLDVESETNAWFGTVPPAPPTLSAPAVESVTPGTTATLGATPLAPLTSLTPISLVGTANPSPTYSYGGYGSSGAFGGFEDDQGRWNSGNDGTSSWSGSSGGGKSSSNGVGGGRQSSSGGGGRQSYNSTPMNGPTPGSRPGSQFDGWNNADEGDRGRGAGWDGSGTGSKGTGSSGGKGGGSSGGKGQNNGGSKGNNSSSGGYISPVLLDLSGDGIAVDTLSSSSKFVELAGDGFATRMAWAGRNTGVLVIDADGDGKITRSSEFAFTEWDPTARTDFEALKNVFDTNGNGKLDAGDARWGEFRVEVNGELVTLDSLGIASIDLTPTGSGRTFADGSAITGSTTYTRTDGTTGAASDAILASEQEAYKLDRTVTTNADGSSSELIIGYAKDGRIAFRNLVTKSADGSTVTTNFDDNGDGVYDRRQTKLSYVVEDGSFVEIVVNFNADNSIANSTKTETSADQKLVTTLLDLYGTGLVDQYQVFEKLWDGSTRTTIQHLSRDGSVLKTVVATAAADGLSKSTSTDVTGDGVADMIETEISTIGNDGNRTRTVKELARDGAVLTSTTVSTTRTSTGTEKTTTSDLDGDGSTDRRTQETTTVSSAGEVTVESASYGADDTLLGKTTLRTSQDGRSTYLARDIDGNGSIDISSSDITIVDAVGERTRTETVTSGNGNLLSRRVVSTSADRKIITENLDINGDGAVDTKIVTTIGDDGATSKTESRFNADGSLISHSTTAVSADGSSSTVSTDIDGDGFTDSEVSTMKSVFADGSATTSERVLSRDGDLISQITLTTNADATSRIIAEDLNGDGSVDRQTSEVVVFNDDASRTKAVTIRSGDSTLLGHTTVDISADRLTTVAVTDSNGDGVIDKHEAETTLVDGQVVLEEKLFTRSGAIYRSTRKTVSANGLSTTVETDINGDGTTDYSTTVDTVIDDDGSRKETTVRKSANGATIQSSSVLTSGNGLTIVSEQDVNGDGIADTRSIQSTVYEQDGSVSKTVSCHERQYSKYRCIARLRRG